jgi:phage baseplate assembly protein W
MLSKDIDLNFTVNPLTGDLNVKKNNDAVKQSLKNLMLLSLYEKPFNPDLGANIRGYLFENYILNTNKYLEDRIRSVILKYEPRIQIKTVNVIPNENNNTLDVYIEYYFSGQSIETFSVNLERTR